VPKLKVMTWNVLYKEKADNILSLIKRVDPDIVCCQEITADSYINPRRDVPHEISELLGGEYRYLEVLTLLDGKPGSMGNAVISKFPITKSRSTLVQKGGSEIRYSAQTRGYVEISFAVDGHEITVGTTHLSYLDRFVETAERTKEADKLIDFISDNNQKFIVTGDFNSLPDSSTIKKMEKIFKSAGPDHSNKTWTTKPFNYENFRVDGLEYRLDYIFVTADIKVLSSDIIKTDFSDHLPILAEVEI
jgi:endonuclease/exonuclease/phosphatase family metal-dependent hydrolase